MPGLEPGCDPGSRVHEALRSAALDPGSQPRFRGAFGREAEFHIFFFKGAKYGKAGTRFCAFAANASIMCGGANMPACQVAM